MVLPYKGRLGLALLGMIVTALTEPLFPAVMKILLDQGFVGKPTPQIWLVPVAIIGIFILRGAATFGTNYMMTWVTTQLLNELRMHMYRRMLEVSIDYYYSTSIGKVVNAMMFEVQQIVDMIRDVLSSLIRDVFTVIGLLAFLLWINWRLTGVALVLIPLIALVVRMTGKRLRRLHRDFLDVNAELTQILDETTRANQVIKVFGGQRYETKRFEQHTLKLRRFSMRMVTTYAATVPVTQLMASLAVAIVIVIALIQSSQNQTTVGGFVSFITAMLMLLAPLKRLAEVNGPMQRGLAAAEDVFKIIDAPIERTDGITLSERVSGKLDFVDVGFTYPGQSQPALSHINLSVMPGETMAFVGISGGGKSTLVSLVPEFFSPTEGEIRVDDKPIRDIALASLRKQIAMVSQNVVLFNDTVAANIAYGDEEPDHDRIMKAVKAAHLTEVVEALPNGIKTVVGDNGMRLSGGQRQRLAIARAIYKNAPILILDEATSALDSESEHAVQSALDELMRGRTTLVIAHRLSTIEHADRIAVIVAGHIVEVGSHEELLSMNGAYANLYHLQFAKDAA
jgi:subfamily B ATP-binding cassette protein MsbA